MSGDKVECPECGYVYPLGTVVLGGEAMEPIVESGGRSDHPQRCSRSVNHRTDTARGLWQQLPNTWGSAGER